MTADTIDVPVVGNVKTNTLIGVGFATVVIVGFFYVRAERNATVDTEAVDPNAGNSTGTFGADIGSGSGGYYATPSAASDTDLSAGTEVISTNAQWTRAAVDYLSANGRDAGAVQDALGKYLAGEALTTEQRTIVQSAKAAIGNEPQTAPPMKMVSTAPAPSTVALIAPKSVGYEKRGKNFIIVKWSAVPSATAYEVDFRWPDGKGRIERSGPDLVETFTGLTAGKSYNFKVRAINSRGVRGPWSNVQSIATTK